jgi:ribosomal protein S12 methylthiotransferase accessory factor
VLSGLLELVERDAFMITWLAGISWPLLDWSGNAWVAEFERRYLAPTGLRVSAVDLSAFWGIPCALGVARSRIGGEAPLGVGAAAATTVERAVEKACDEAVRVRSWAQALRASDPQGATVPAAEQIVEFDEHVHYYAYDRNAAAADFLDASQAHRPTEEMVPVVGATPADQVAAICARLAARGVTVYAADVTAPDVRAAGLCVARVLATELCTLDVVHAYRHLGGRRLYEEPARLGVRAKPLSEHDLNPAPHPFP